MPTFRSGRLRASIATLTLALGSFWSGSAAHAFDATTRLTNVAITDRDVGQALSAGLDRSFDQIFPEHQYGVRVLVDAIDLRNGQTLIYMSLGLSRRLAANGQHLQQHATQSHALFLPSSIPLQQQHSAVISQLTQLAGSFSQPMIQNAGQVR